MYDFRQPRRAHHRRAASKPRKSVVSAIRSPKPTIQKRAKSGSLIQVLTSTLISIVGGLLIIAVCLYFFVTRMAFHLWPLTSTQTLVLVPTATTAQPFIQVVVMDPTAQTINIATLTEPAQLARLTPWLHQGYQGGMSLRLGRLVDSVLTMPTDKPIETQAPLAGLFHHFFAENQNKGEMLRWWLFALAMPDSHVHAKTITSPAAWQTWLTGLTQNQSAAGCSVAVINTTKVSGLSRFLSQVLEQSGYQVIRVDSQPQALEKSQIFSNPERANCQTAATQLLTFMPGEIQVTPDAALTQQARADIVWLVGNDVGGPAAELVATP